jgi:GT2 family glycosyltransferase
VTITESELNKGLARSVIHGVSEVLTKYDRVIVLEDDLITSSNFLEFMNTSLNHYNNISEVISISGYSFPNISNENTDAYLPS